MRLVFAIGTGLLGIALILFGYFPVRLYVRMGYILIALGAALLAAIPFSFWLKARAPQLFLIAGRCALWVAAVGLALLIVSGVQIVSRYRDEEAPKGSVVIVLGAGLSKLDHITPSRLLADRLRSAEAYLKARPDAVCIVSGGQGKEELVSEAQAMKTYLVDVLGIGADRIIMEDRSLDTEQNLKYCAGIMRENGLFEACKGNIVLVTSGFHQFRSHYFANREGFASYTLSARVQPWFLPMYWLRESLAIVLEVWL